MSPNGSRSRVPSPAVMAVGILSLAYLSAYMDRMMISIVVEPIKAELHLSDTQLGLLTGFAFVLFYSTFGIAIARLADRYSRKHIMTVSILAWSAMTALTGVAQNFWQMFVYRMATGIGEAGVFPAGTSLIGDYFPPHQRAAPNAVFVAGALLGLTVGLVGGGYVAEHYGWRSAFIVLGLVGIPIALLNAALLQEPQRGMSDAIARVEQTQSLREVCQVLLKNKTYVQITLAGGFAYSLTLGVIQWMPALMMRKFELGIAQVGALFGIALGLGSVLGTIIGGVVCNKLAARDLRWLVRFPFLVSFCYLPLYGLAIYLPDWTLSTVAIFLVNVVAGSSYGPIVAIVQSIVSPAIRATAMAIYVGLTLGIAPAAASFVIGLMSDVLRASMGEVGALETGLAVSVLVTSILTLVHLRFTERVFLNDCHGTGRPPAATGMGLRTEGMEREHVS